MSNFLDIYISNGKGKEERNRKKERVYDKLVALRFNITINNLFVSLF